MKQSGRRCLSWAGLLLLGLSAAAAYGQDEEEREPVNHQREREQWFLEQRAWPHNHIPRGAHQNSIEQLDRMLAAEASRVRRMSAAGGATIASSPLSWTQIGPWPGTTSTSVGNVGGRVTALAVDPTNANIVYQGAAQGGVWKSTDGGASWTPLTDTQASLAIGSITIDPTDPQIIYVGTGEMHFSTDSYYGAGILKSTDGGATWMQLGQSAFVGPFGSTTGGAKIASIAVSPSNHQIVLAGVQIFSSGSTPGIYRSTDGGSTWANVQSGAPGTNVIFDPVNPSIAYAALSATGANTANGVYKSTDGGATWNSILTSASSVLPPGSSIGRTEIALAPSDHLTLYASVANATGSSDDILAFLVSTDGGQNWTSRASPPNFCAGQCWYDHVIRVQPGNANVVFAGGAASNVLMRSTNGGVSWTEVGSGGSGRLHVDMHAIAFSADGSKMWAGNDGGVWSTTNVTTSPVNWTNLNQTLATLQVYPGMAIDVNPGNATLAGTQDNGSLRFTGSPAWPSVTCGDSGWSAIDNTGTTYYSACQRIDIRKSTNSGTAGTWSSNNASGISTSDRQRFIPAMVMDPNNNQTLYFGTQFLYQTINGAGSWQAISGDLTTGGGTTSTYTIMSIAVAPSDSNTVYVGTGDGKLQVTANALQGATATFTDRSAGLPGRAVTSIAIDRTNPQIAVIGLSGFTFGGSASGHIFRTTNGGANWTDITGTLEQLNTPVNDIVIDPDFANVLYAGTDVGVFRTLDGGATWTTLMTGLPRAAVLSLKLHRSTRTLRAGTHGRSVWDLLVAPVAGVSPASLTFAAQNLNQASNAQTIIVPNTGNLPLTISAVSASGDFAQTSDCVATLPVGNSCTITVTFTPTAAGARSGNVTITGNVVGGSTTVPLSGTGVSPVTLSLPGTSAVNVSFGSVLVMSSATIPVTVTNNGGSPVHVSALNSPGGDFAQTSDCPGTLAIGASCTILVSLRPTGLGYRNDSFTIFDDAGTGMQYVNVNGTGVDLALALSRIARPARTQADTVVTSSASPAETSQSAISPWIVLMPSPPSSDAASECRERLKKKDDAADDNKPAQPKCKPVK